MIHSVQQLIAWLSQSMLVDRHGQAGKQVSQTTHRSMRRRQPQMEHLSRRQVLAAQLDFSSPLFQQSGLSQSELIAMSQSNDTLFMPATHATNQSAQTIAAIPGSLGQTQNPIAEKIGNELHALYQLSLMITNSSSAATRASSLQAANPIVQVNLDGTVAFEAIAKNDVKLLRKELEAIGVRVSSEFGKVLGGAIAAEQLATLASLPSLQFVRPVYHPITHVGSVQNEADRSMRSDVAKTRFSVDGSGIKIGVLSDSWNSKGTANNGIASGDLPGPGNPLGFTSPVQILQETPLTNRSDEGRAMLELIHDVSPAASLAFHSADGGSASFAQGIIALANAGSDVIVDDVTYFAEPFFQDGIIAQAATSVVGRGIPFFSSAGNQGNESYESFFRSGLQSTIGGVGPYDFHDFDPGPGLDVAQFVAVAPGQTAILSFQWDQPFASAGGPGSASDMDIFAFDQDGILVAASANNNIGGDAVEVLRIQNTTNSPKFYDVVFGHNLSKGGPKPGYVKYYGAGHPLTFDIFEYSTLSGTIFGHHGIAAGAGIAAAPYFKTPEFGVTPAFPQETTSHGGVPVLFTPNGTRLTAPEFRQQPRLTAPDETNNTFFGVDTDSDGKPNFAGTSAAAPHVAAVAALMLEAAGGSGTLTPQQIYTTLEQTASDMLTPGFDLVTGHGFINAEAAIAEVANNSNPVVNGTNGNDLFVLTYQSNTSSGNVSVTRSSNGGTPVNLGSFPVNAGLTVNGGNGNDSIRINGSNLNDLFVISSSGITVNGSALILNSINARTLVGRTGSDRYRFDTDSALGSYSLIETGTGADTIDFSSTSNQAVRLDLALTSLQIVNANLSLLLNAGNVFENLIGGAKNDVLSGNSLANRIEGRAGNDTLTGKEGNDTLVGGQDDDTYLFANVSTAELDVVSEATNQGRDSLNFSAVTTAVSINLGLTTVQQVQTNRRIRLTSGVAMENVIGGSNNDTLIGNSLNNVLVGLNGRDTIDGVSGRNVLIGGSGLDTILGGTGEDILIAGVTNFDTRINQLNLVMTEWSSTRTYAQRVGRLRAGVGTPVTSLKAKNTVLTDANTVDRLRGKAGSDWYFAAVDDVILDLASGEQTDRL